MDVQGRPAQRVHRAKTGDPALPVRAASKAHQEPPALQGLGASLGRRGSMARMASLAQPARKASAALLARLRSCPHQLPGLPPSTAIP